MTHILTQNSAKSTPSLSGVRNLNALLRTVIDENPNIILMKDWDGKFLLGNRALANLYGTTPEELVGKDDGAFNPNAEQVAFYLENVREVMSQDKTQIVLEESTNAATGETLFYQSIKVPLTTPDGKKQILVIANDVSELKRVQQKLEESERRLRYVLEVTGEGVWDWDLRTNIVTHNRQWCQITGVDDDHIQHPVEDFVSLLHPEDKAQVMSRLQLSLQGEAPYQSEHRMCMRNGDVVWVLDRGNVVERDPNGTPLRMVGSVVDISERKAAELAAAQRELYLRATLDNVPFSFWLKDTQGRYLAVNKVFADACGQTDPAHVVGLTDFDVWPQALAQRHHDDDLTVMASRSEKLVEEPIGDGSNLGWLETYKKPILAKDGSMLGTVGYARDISQRKQMEQNIAANEQRWELAVSGANDGIWDWNPQTGHVYYSTRWKTMLGYNEHDISASVDEWTQRIHPDDFTNTMAQVQRHLRGETAYYESEHRLRCKNGDYKWILDRGRAHIDEHGKPLRMLGSHSDITERRMAQQKVREHAAQLNAIFDLSPDGFVTFDDVKRVKYVSPAFTSLTGLASQDVIGIDEQSFSQQLAGVCLPEATFPGLAELRAQLLGDTSKNTPKNKMQSSARRLVIELADDSKRVLEVGLRESDAQSVSCILYLRDITLESKVDRMKSEFLSTAAHELRTPMASIYGFSEVLMTQELAKKDQKEMLEIIYRQSGLMASILNELLDLARIEARRGKDFVFQAISAQVLIHKVVHEFKPPDNRHAPELDMPSSPLMIRADDTKARMAILNVLSNAYKYSNLDDPVRIVLERQGDHAAIRIEDDGIGMTPTQVERVGERFFRADSSGKVSGTGLGMSIVKEIMALHQGQLEIASVSGLYTNVTLAFPFATSFEPVLAK